MIIITIIIIIIIATIIVIIIIIIGSSIVITKNSAVDNIKHKSISISLMTLEIIITYFEKLIILGK